MSLTVFAERTFFHEEISLTVFADRTATYEERLNKASLPSLANKKFQGILILMYKVKLLLAPEHITFFMG